MARTKKSGKFDFTTLIIVSAIGAFVLMMISQMIIPYFQEAFTTAMGG